jgi:very-short-patch-repair endonuclease
MRQQTTPNLADIADEQHGVVTLAQLRAFGLDDAAVRRWSVAGRVHRVHRGVYAVGHRRLSREGRWLAAVLACGPGAVLSHRSGAALWGIRATAAARIDVTVPRDSGRRSTAAIIVHRPRRSIEATTHNGIPVTTPTQTLVDLSSVLPRPALERAVEVAETLRLLDVNSLPPRLAQLVGPVDNTRSALERRFLALCRRARLPLPLVNTQVEGFEVDFCWPPERLIVETDGHRHHGTRAAFERDRERDARLTALGWRVVRITYRQLHERPGEVVELLVRLLQRA